MNNKESNKISPIRYNNNDDDFNIDDDTTNNIENYDRFIISKLYSIEKNNVDIIQILNYMDQDNRIIIDKLNNIENDNSAIIKMINNNYNLTQAIIDQNEKTLKNIQLQNYKRLKIAYACCAFILIIIGIIIGAMIQIHVL